MIISKISLSHRLHQWVCTMTFFAQGQSNCELCSSSKSCVVLALVGLGLMGKVRHLSSFTVRCDKSALYLHLFWNLLQKMFCRTLFLPWHALDSNSSRSMQLVSTYWVAIHMRFKTLWSGWRLKYFGISKVPSTFSRLAGDCACPRLRIDRLEEVDNSNYLESSNATVNVIGKEINPRKVKAKANFVNHWYLSHRPDNRLSLKRSVSSATILIFLLNSYVLKILGGFLCSTTSVSEGLLEAGEKSGGKYWNASLCVGCW